jgi:hypothetical protein
VFLRGRLQVVEGQVRDSLFASQKVFTGRVGEWLKPADCKSAAPCGLRRFESFPVHQALAVGIAETAGQSHPAMFERGPIRGASAAQEKCAAKGCFWWGTGFGLGSFLTSVVESVRGLNHSQVNSPAAFFGIAAERSRTGLRIQYHPRSHYYLVLRGLALPEGIAGL